MQALFNLAQSVFDLIIAIPMPWRALALIIIGYILLYAEFRLTSILRRTLGRPIPGTGLVDFALKWTIVFSILGGIWWGAVRIWDFAEPTIMASSAAPYVVMARSWWTAATEFVHTWR